MKPQSEKEYIADHVKLASKSLAEHQILYRDATKVTVGRPDSSCYRCDLIVSGRYLIMVGDCSAMIWAHSPSSTIEGAIAWMATDDISYYVLQKAHIGMGGGIGCDAFEEDVALWEAQDYLRSAVEAGCRSAERWRKVVKALESEGEEPWNHESVASLLYLMLGDSDIPTLGVVPSSRLLWAWSIVRKAHELLRPQP